jgi:hypothetical protein
MTAFADLFREFRAARRQLRRQTTLRRDGPATPAFERAAIRFAQASSALLRAWDRNSKRLPPCPVMRSDADAVACGPAAQVEALVDFMIAAGIVIDPHLRPIDARETAAMVLRAATPALAL